MLCGAANEETSFLLSSALTRTVWFPPLFLFLPSVAVFLTIFPFGVILLTMLAQIGKGIAAGFSICSDNGNEVVGITIPCWHDWKLRFAELCERLRVEDLERCSTCCWRRPRAGSGTPMNHRG